MSNMSFSLSAQLRKSGENVKRLRKSGFIPAVVYGRDVEAQPLSLSSLEFSKVYRLAGESSIIDLSVSGKKAVNVLIHDVSLHPVSGAPLHADFYQVNMDEKIEANIPISFCGESLAVKALGGVLVKALDEVAVSCLPGNLPRELQVDISALATFDDQIRVADISLPEGVSLVGDPNVAVALVEPPRSDEEVASLDSEVIADVSKVEGISKETAPSA